MPPEAEPRAESRLDAASRAERCAIAAIAAASLALRAWILWDLSRQDPFFERPYEASATTEAAWESKAAPAPRSPSPNIKPKRKVAALLGGGNG